MNSEKKISLCPDDNELAKFIEGTLSGERLLYVKKHLGSCSICNESIRLSMEFNLTDSLPAIQGFNVLLHHAAKASDNLCVLLAEKYILEQCNNKIDIAEISDIAQHEGWLSGKGIQFRNIGKILEYFNIKVERKVDCTINEIQESLDKGEFIIVGVDSGEIFADTPMSKAIETIEDWISKRPDHALIVTGLEPGIDNNRTINLLSFETAEPRNLRIPLNQFIEAWEDSKFYMVLADIRH